MVAAKPLGAVEAPNHAHPSSASVRQGAGALEAAPHRSPSEASILVGARCSAMTLHRWLNAVALKSDAWHGFDATRSTRPNGGLVVQLGAGAASSVGGCRPRCAAGQRGSAPKKLKISGGKTNV